MNSSKPLEWWKDPTFAPFFGGGDAGRQQQQPQYQNVQPIGAPGYGYTGAGADNIVQQNRRVPGAGSGQYDAHENEFVMDANTTQAIGPDVLAQVMKAAKNNTLDLNKLREAVGMTPKPGFQTGGMAPAAIGTNEKKLNAAANTTSAANTIPAAPTFPWKPKPKPDVIKPTPLTPINPEPVDPGKINLDQGVSGNILTPDIVTPIGTTIMPNQNLVMDSTNVNPASLLTGTEVKPAKMAPQAITPIEPAKKAPQAFIPTAKEMPQAFTPLANKNAAIKAINDLPVEIQDEINKNKIPQQEIIDYLMGIMKGDNPYFKMLQDLLTQKIGGAGAAATAAMKQEAAMSGWGKEQLSSLGIGRQRDVEAQASGALGELAAQQAGMGMEAAGKLWGMSQDIQAQQNWEKQFGLSKEQWEKEFGWNKESWEKSFDYTKLTNEQKNEQWQKLFDQDNDRWNKTWNEALKDKDFNKQTDMLNALLSSGGEANLKKAAEMMKQMYGQDIDFDNLVDAEKQKDFNTAWNNMGGLIASNMDWEDALMTMKKDGTFDKLGMTEEDLKRVYEKQKMQNDPVYKMMNQVDQWVKQGIMTEEQGQQYKDLFQWSLTHPDGIEIKDGWIAKDEAGNEVGFFTSKQELDDFLKKNPNYKDGGFMKGHISKKNIGGDTGTGTGTETGTISDAEWNKLSLEQQWEKFKSTVPDTEQDKWDFNKWKDGGKFKSFDDWSKSQGTNVTNKLTDFQKTINEKGWPPPPSSYYTSNTEENERQKKLFEDGRKKVMSGDVTNYKYDDIIGNKKEDFLNKFSKDKQGSVFVFSEHANPLVFMMESQSPRKDAKSLMYRDLYTGEIVRLTFYYDKSQEKVEKIVVNE